MRIKVFPSTIEEYYLNYKFSCFHGNTFRMASLYKYENGPKNCTSYFLVP